MVSDEPLTPAGRLFLESETEQIVNVAIKFKNPIKVESFRTQFLNSHFTDHPRFTSLLVRNHFWRQSAVDIDRHIVVIPDSGERNDSIHDREKLVTDEKVELKDEDVVVDGEKLVSGEVNDEIIAVNDPDGSIHDREKLVRDEKDELKDEDDVVNGEKLVSGVVIDEAVTVNDGHNHSNGEKLVNDNICTVNEELRNEEDVENGEKLVTDEANDEKLVNDELKNEEEVVNGEKLVSGVVNDEADTVNDEDDEVNEYLADLSVSSPLSTDKPLWEIHFLMKQNVVVLRLHHALGDGISLMSLFIASCKKSDDPDSMPDIVSSESVREGEPPRRMGVREILKICWITLVYVIGLLLRPFLKDEETAVSGGAGVEYWPRKLATARFSIEDMKVVKKVVPNGTINDVLFGVLSLGLSRYLDLYSSKALKEGLQITGMAMVNLRKQPGLQELTKLMKAKSKSGWGNKFGIFLLPLYYHKPSADPIQYLKRSKAMLDRKKQSLEAHFSYMLGDFVMSFLGPKVASWLNYRIMCNTTFTISNIIGPKEEMTFAGNPITSLRVNSTALPHAITMHMVSYSGGAYMQILAPKEIISDPKVLAKCFEDALIEMKKAAIPADVPTTIL